MHGKRIIEELYGRRRRINCRALVFYLYSNSKDMSALVEISSLPLFWKTTPQCYAWHCCPLREILKIPFYFYVVDICTKYFFAVLVIKCVNKHFNKLQTMFHFTHLSLSLQWYLCNILVVLENSMNSKTKERRKTYDT